MRTKIIFLTLLSLFAVKSSYAQKPLKENLFVYINSVIPPPKTCKEAYDKITCNQENCSADILFNDLAEKCKAKIIAIDSPDGTDNDMMKKMQDPEFQKKMQNMSDEEKMKIGMQMAKQYQSQNNNFVPEPEPVIETLTECSNMDGLTGQDQIKANSTVQAKLETEGKFNERHQKIDDWLETELQKLPLIKTNVDLAIQDPVKVKQLKLQAADKHINVENDYLKITGQDWTAEIAKNNRHFSKFENLLAKIHYGDDVRNKQDLHIIAEHQVMILNAVLEEIGMSKNSYEEAANYIVEKKNIEKQ
jgi:hypothetical protein